jgi:putative PIN family toxin of toxin-antitoxin system
MKIAVFDTNIWVSGLVFGGRCRTLLAGVLQRSCAVAISEPLITELGDVLASRKFHYSHEAVAAILEDVRKMALMAYPRVAVKAVPDDPDDDRVLECALESGAQWIVSGDRHLLKMGTYRGIRIVDPAVFAEEIRKAGDNPYEPKEEETDSGGPPPVNETGKKYRIKKRSKR